MFPPYLFWFLVFLRGGTPTHPLGVVPEFRAGCCAGGPELYLASSSFLSLSGFLLQEYHNLRVTAYNHNVERLEKRTADLS